MAMHEPRDARDLCEIVAEAAANGCKLELSGSGSKADFGAPRDADVVSIKAICGVVDYDPAELVLTVRSGTLLSEVEALVLSESQMLAFEPWGAADATIGGTIAAGAAGSRRVTAGSARDHLLGFSAVSGKGESYVAGAKVVKNVTGFDLPKLMAGSWGRIGAMTELTLKVLPRPRTSVTMVARGLSPSRAHQAMAHALGSNADVSAAAHLARGVTMFRLTGFGPSVEARSAALPRLLHEICEVEASSERDAIPLWQEAMTGAGISGAIRWCVHLPPRKAPELIDRLLPLGIDWAMDWGGARVWIALDDQNIAVREVARSLGGEARLVRAPAEMRIAIPALQPRSAGFASLEQRVRFAFDPVGVFATGRFAEDAHAD